MALTQKLDLTIISNQRGALFGLAILAIVWHHLPVVIPFAVEGTITIGFLNNIFHYLCDVGVDIFFLLSGFGLYYSMKKREGKKETDNDFYKKRIARIAPYYFVGVTLIIVLNYPGMLSWQQIAGNYLMIGLWIGLKYQFYWFFQLILVLYFLTPMLYRSIENSRIKTLVISFIVVLMLWVASWGEFDLYIMVFRILSFVIGMYFGYLAFNGFKISIIYELALYSVTIATFLIYWYVEYVWKPVNLGYVNSFYGTKYIYHTVATPGLVLGLSRILSFISSIRYAETITKLLAFVGNYTAGIYIFHMWISHYNFSVIFESIVMPPTADTVFLSILSWIPALIVLTVGGIIFEYVIRKALEIPNYLKKEKGRARTE